MGGLSTVAEVAEVDDRTPARVLWLRAIAALAAVASILALWVGESARAEHDLQLIAPGHVRPGSTIAVRALFLANVDAVQGPTLRRVPVDVRLTDEQGRELSHARLVDVANDSMEGRLPIPSTVSGSLVLDASAQLPGEAPMRTRRWLEVRPAAPGLPLQGRVAAPLRQFSQGRVITRTEAPAPEPFEARVVGGACAPEVPCRLLVWVGEPAAAIQLRPSKAVTPDGEPQPREPSSGLVELSLVVHGPEAEVVVEARREGQIVAERAIRLPVALGEVLLNASRSVVDDAAGLQFTAMLPPGRTHVILDAFRDRHWEYSSTVAAVTSDTVLQVPFTDARPGLWRVQGRVDRFSAEGAGTRLIYLRGPGQDDAAVLQHIALRSSAWVQGRDPVRKYLERPDADVLANVERWAAFALAPGEQLRLPQPQAVGGRNVQLARLERTRNYLRFGVVAMILLGGVAVASTAMRRGLHASAEARTLLADAGSEDALSARERRRQTAWVLLLSAGVCMAFLAGALLILAKPLWF